MLSFCFPKLLDLEANCIIQQASPLLQTAARQVQVSPLLSASLLEGRDAVNLFRSCVEFISFDYDIGIIHGRESFFRREDGDILSHIRLYHSHDPVPGSCR